jgi:molybdopterin molybdotransferase
MHIEIQFTDQPIAAKNPPPSEPGAQGAVVEFNGVVRGEEGGRPIAALIYEAYPEMAARQIRRLLEDIATRHPCGGAKVIHRLGIVPVGEAAIYVGITSRHRAGGIALLAEFMDRLKRDVPIWKHGVLPAPLAEGTRPPDPTPARVSRPAVRSLEEAMAEISSHCQVLPAIRWPLVQAFGRVLRESVDAPGDLPPFDCSTRDGYAIRADDPGPDFQVVDTLPAAGWKPRQLQPGETVRVATGAPLPCGGLRVVMQEDVERRDNHVRLVRTAAATNLRLRGEDVKAGQPLVTANSGLTAGALALLAAAGCVHPLVSPRLRVSHFTTGDELVAPDQAPGPGQIRDSNSMLVRGLLSRFACDLEQQHLPEDFEAAWGRLELHRLAVADVILISGGASVGDKDFTRPLLERLGFEIIFSQVNVRPGRPLIFGVNGPRVAFGLPGNPLAHFVCFHFAVATALARLTGDKAPEFLRGRLAVGLDDPPCPRETLWPARLECAGCALQLHPLAWASSGDVTCFARAHALVRKPANCSVLAAGTEVDFLPATGMLAGT